MAKRQAAGLDALLPLLQEAERETRGREAKIAHDDDDVEEHYVLCEFEDADGLSLCGDVVVQARARSRRGGAAELTTRDACACRVWTLRLRGSSSTGSPSREWSTRMCAPLARAYALQGPHP